MPGLASRSRQSSASTTGGSTDGIVQIYKNGILIATVTLNTADQSFFNAKGGKIGIWNVAASNAILDDFGGGTVA